MSADGIFSYQDDESLGSDVEGSSGGAQVGEVAINTIRERVTASTPDKPVLRLKFGCLTIDDEIVYDGYESDGYIGPTMRKEDIHHEEEAVQYHEVFGESCNLAI